MRRKTGRSPPCRQPDFGGFRIRIDNPVLWVQSALPEGREADMISSRAVCLTTEMAGNRSASARMW